MPKRTAIPTDLASVIDATLLREARRNERFIAAIRVFVLLVIALLEVYWIAVGEGIPSLARLPVFIWFFGALGLWLALRRGWFHPSLSFVLPVLDTAVCVWRMNGAFLNHTVQELLDTQELVTVSAVASLVILTGAMRLRSDVLALCAGLGMSLYAFYAARLGLPLLVQVVHLVLLGGVWAMAFVLMRLVARAVRSEVARVTLARFLPESVIDGAHKDPLALITKPRAVDATILISDLRGFTTWAENRSPMEVLGQLNAIQGAFAEVVRQHGGTVDKFLGDGMLAVFGAPEPLPDHAERAVQAARGIQEAVEQFRKRTGAFEAGAGVGVNSGEVVIGCLGSGLRMEFTVLGDTVNTASRIEGLTKSLSKRVLISEETVSRLPSREGLVDLGPTPIRGRIAPLGLWTLEEPPQ